VSVVTHLIFCFLAVGAGVSVAVQQILNANLRSQIGSPWWAGFVSYLVGMTVMLTAALAIKGPRLADVLSARTAPMSWAGGVFGAVFVGTAILLIPRLGVATVLALVVVGQMAASVGIDHFGLFGAAPHPASLPRLAGAALLVAGVILVGRS
jgi:transporter family-2 protein